MVQIEGLRLSAADISQYGNKAIVVGEGGYDEIEDKGKIKRVLKVNIELGGKAKRDWSPNKTSMAFMVPAYGEDTKGWIGKPVFYTVTQQHAFGKLQDVIVGKPEEQKIADASEIGKA